MQGSPESGEEGEDTPSGGIRGARIAAFLTR
jgi:hypothetical protein